MNVFKAMDKALDSVAEKQLVPKKSSKVIVCCEYCDEKFMVARCIAIDPRRGRFCSKACYDNYRKTGVKRTCKHCEKEFVALPSAIEVGGGIHCSSNCKYEASRKVVTCEFCRYEFKTTASLARSRRFCEKACFDAWQLGRKRINWNKEGEYSKVWREITVLVRARDKHICRLCKMTEEDNLWALSVHHIDYNKANNNKDNLISLCLTCHGMSNGNQDWWKAKFTEIMKGNGA